MRRAAVAILLAASCPAAAEGCTIRSEGKRFSRTEYTHYGRPSGAEERR